MAKSKSDISNSAIRIFLNKVGEYYDTERGFAHFSDSKKCKEELLSFFKNECCYCERKINIETISLDHLIPINKDNLGLHAWGNIVPCCASCNNKKQKHKWLDFLNSYTKPELVEKKMALIIKFVKSKKYDPKLDISSFANNLYKDVGEVSMTLINLRYDQAKDAIKNILKK